MWSVYNSNIIIIIIIIIIMVLLLFLYLLHCIYALQIQAGAGALIAGANLFVFGTIYSFFVFFARDDEWDWTTF